MTTLLTAILAAMATLPTGAPVVGTVASISGDDGSVLVGRGEAVYFLQQGDALFAGDKVFTRTDAQVVLTSANCDVTIEEVSSLLVDTDLCGAEPMTLASTASDTPAAARIARGALRTGGAAVGTDAVAERVTSRRSGNRLRVSP